MVNLWSNNDVVSFAMKNSSYTLSQRTDYKFLTLSFKILNHRNETTCIEKNKQKNKKQSVVCQTINNLKSTIKLI